MALHFTNPWRFQMDISAFGHYCQLNDQKLRGYLLVAKSFSTDDPEGSTGNSPALEKSLDYTLVYSSCSHGNEDYYVWIPNPPKGYKAMGFVVTTESNMPGLEDVRCIRADLTETCEIRELIFDSKSLFPKDQFYVWSIRSCERGVFCEGVPIGTFYCSTEKSSEDDLSIACLKNLNSSQPARPNLNQVHALIKHYGPTLYFHPDEVFMPSSVSWFFKNGALLYKEGKDKGLAIDSKGSILPGGGTNDEEFWLDLPLDGDDKDHVMYGCIETAELYVHVKPSSGGTLTDIAIWIFCPFNGPSTIKVGAFNYPFKRIGQHVGDWEHYTLCLSNFSGELWGIYFSEHSGGKWQDASKLEFIEGNKAIVYASWNGHACFRQEG